MNSGYKNSVVPDRIFRFQVAFVRKAMEINKITRLVWKDYDVVMTN